MNYFNSWKSSSQQQNYSNLSRILYTPAQNNPLRSSNYARSKYYLLCCQENRNWVGLIEEYLYLHVFCFLDYVVIYISVSSGLWRTFLAALEVSSSYGSTVFCLVVRKGCSRRIIEGKDVYS
ncbi:hypothetical protein Q3G72_018323 [Acer saccharum]|nr:hypothetical protein Q3G72_018323 [Acer saccharum]